MSPDDISFSIAQISFTCSCTYRAGTTLLRQRKQPDLSNASSDQSRSLMHTFPTSCPQGKRKGYSVIVPSSFGVPYGMRQIGQRSSLRGSSAMIPLRTINSAVSDGSVNQAIFLYPGGTIVSVVSTDSVNPATFMSSSSWVDMFDDGR